ncbi:MAG: M23 family metallopeptidase [Solirubrobacteraceae bacterium]
MPRLLAPFGFALLLALPAPPAAAAPWPWPVRGRVLGAFRAGPDPFAAGQHRGIDIAAPLGTPVGAACAGTVRFAGPAGRSGLTVTVQCGALTATYLHLGATAVGRGDRLAAGAPIGTVGRSGTPRHRTAHLHFGVRRTGRRWSYVDPLTLLGSPNGRRERPLLGRPGRRPGVAPPLGPAPGAAARRAAPARPPARQAPAAAWARAARGPDVPPLAWAGAALAALAARGTWRLARRRSGFGGARPAPRASQPGRPA